MWSKFLFYFGHILGRRILLFPPKAHALHAFSHFFLTKAILTNVLLIALYCLQIQIIKVSYVFTFTRERLLVNDTLGLRYSGAVFC